MKEYRSQSMPKEINTQKKDICNTYRSNSQFHYKDISNYNYIHRIRLNPLGESKTMDIKYQFPLNHVQDSSIKNDYLSDCKKIDNKNAYNKADIQSHICSQIKKQKYQNLLEKDKHIENICNSENKKIKSELENRKIILKQQLTKIINDALLFSKKNSPIKSMLPENINEIVEKAKKQTEDMSFSLNISHLSRISSMKEDKKPKKNEFLSLLGVDLENLTINHVNIDIDKAWNYIVKLSKGRKIEDLLRVKVVNAIMSLTEKKASEKVRKIYEKLEIYHKYMEKKKADEIKRKKREEEDKYQYMLKNNPKEFLKLKMIKSLSEPKLIFQNENKKKKMNKRSKDVKQNTKKKKMKRSESAVFQTNRKNIEKFNAYKDIDKIINFINDSKKNSQSKFCKGHFMNIKMTKSMDNNLKKMLNKNRIGLK